MFNAQVEMFMYAQQLAEQRRAKPARRHHHRAAERRGRRRVAVGHGLQPLLPAAVRGRQRDDPQRHLPRHERVPREPRPVRRCSSSDPDRHIAGAIEEILRWASPVMYFRRNATKDIELGGQTIKAGDKISLWYISANRDEDVLRRPVPLRHHPRPEPPHRLRRRRPPLLPRRPAGPHGDPRAVRGAGQARTRASRRSARPTASARNFIGGIKHLPVAPPRGLTRRRSGASRRAGRGGGDVAGDVAPALQQHDRADEHERRHDQEGVGQVALHLAVDDVARTGRR